jgi:hypothetical protein
LRCRHDVDARVVSAAIRPRSTSGTSIIARSRQAREHEVTT